MEIGVEGQRLVIETISTLVHIKSTMVDLILRPAGVPPEVYKDLLYKRNEATGYTLSKRQIAPLIIERIKAREDGDMIFRTMIEIAAQWSSFHLANEEFSARATVQKAREFLGTLEVMEAREAALRERARKEAIARMERERAEIIKKQSELLLMMFDELAISEDPQRRGFLLQDLLNRLFDIHEIPVHKSFTRNSGAEQIDGGFRLEGWHYLLECRWRKKLADIRELDGFAGQVRRSGKQTMGLFLSANGWSENVPPMLKQESDKAIILMDGYDLRCILSGQIDLKDFLLAKAAKLNFESEPYLGAKEYLNQHD